MLKSPLEMDYEERKSVLIQKCFIEPADRDYLTARWAYQNGMFENFYWASAQALEKYMKGALLYNNKSTTDYRHNINHLYNAVCDIKSDLKDMTISMPNTTGSGREAWEGKKMSLFIDYINTYGSPDARYSLAGIFINGPVIHPLDIICGKLREFIRFNNFTSEDLFEWSFTRSFFHEKLDRSIKWAICLDLPLESLYCKTYSVGQGEELRFCFRNMNFYFFQDRDDGEKVFGGQNFTMAPLINHLYRLKEIEKEEYNINTIERLRNWANENIFLSKDTRNAIKLEKKSKTK